jgi:hypothetical protein
MLALPSRSVLAVPLWVATQGDAADLAELELTSRHLLRKSAEVYALPLLEDAGRSLVLALAAVDDDAAMEYMPRARVFEFSARLIDPSGADIVVWRELGDLCFAVYRDAECVFFTSTGESSPGPAFCGAVVRTVLQLRAEGVTTRMPALLRLVGGFSKEDGASLGEALRLDWELEEVHSAPVLSETASGVAPPTGREAIHKRGRLHKLALFAAGGLAAYGLLLFLVASDLVWRRIQLHQLQEELEEIQPAATAGQLLVTQWRQIQSSVDPNSFAIDQLAAVASEIPSEQVRLTLFNLERGRLTIAGEAADVSQAYEFFERVKKAPLLQSYDWTSRQPQLAGRNKVRFEMEGLRPDAKTGEE